MQQRKKSAANEVTIGKDIQFVGRVLLAIGAVVAVIGSVIEREGENKQK